MNLLNTIKLQIIHLFTNVRLTQSFTLLQLESQGGDTLPVVAECGLVRPAVGLRSPGHLDLSPSGSLVGLQERISIEVR